MIDFSKVTDNIEVVELLKQIEVIKRKINQLDKMAIINYDLECLQNVEVEGLYKQREENGSKINQLVHYIKYLITNI